MNLGDPTFEYSFRLGVSFLLSLAAGILLVPFAAYYSAIVVGFPFTALIRKLTAQHRSLTIDVSFIKVIANLFDGFYAALVAKMFFNIMDMRFRVMVLFLMGIGKVIFVFKRKDLLGSNVDTSDLVEEMCDLVIYFLGLFLCQKLLPYL